MSQALATAALIYGTVAAHVNENATIDIMGKSQHVTVELIRTVHTNIEHKYL